MSSLTTLLDRAIQKMEQDDLLKQELLRREQARIKAENDRRLRDELSLKTLQTSSNYLQEVCDLSSAKVFSMHGFTDAVLGLIRLGELCGQAELDLIRTAILTRPELLSRSTLRQYFRKVQDIEVGKLYLDQFLAIPETTEQLSHDHPTAAAAKMALIIAAENYGAGKKEMIKKFAHQILTRFPGMPGTEEEGFKSLLLVVSRTGVLKDEVPKAPPVHKQEQLQEHHKASASKSVTGHTGGSKASAIARVHAMVLPGVTGKLGELSSHNATERAKANKKSKRKVA